MAYLTHSNCTVHSPLELLTTGKWTDLTLRCDGKEFPVHRSWACMKSPVIYAACEGEFEEAKTGKVDVTIADSETLWKMLMYIHTGDYDDGSVAEVPEVEEQEEDQDKDVLWNIEVDAMEEAEHKSALSSTEAESATKVSDDNHAINDILIHNTRVCVAAEYYQMPTLSSLAMQKFEAAWDTFEELGFGAVVEEVYNHLADDKHPLRASVSNKALEHLDSLSVNADFMAQTMRIPEFAGDWLRKTRASLNSAEVKLHLMEKTNDAGKARLASTQKDFFKVIDGFEETRRCCGCNKEFSAVVRTDPASACGYRIMCRICNTSHRISREDNGTD